MDGVRLQIDADVLVHIHKVCGLDHPLEAIDVHNNLIVHAEEGYRGDNALQHALVLGHNVHILGADDHVHRLPLVKTAVKAGELLPGEGHQPVCQHEPVKDVALTDKVRHKGILRLVVDIHRCADLLDATFRHDDHRVRHGEGLLLVMGDENKGDACGLLQVFQLLLHVLAQLQVESGQRLVQQQHLRPVDNGPCYGHTLLLSAGKAGNAALVKALQCHQIQHLADLLVNHIPLFLLFTKGKGDVFINIQMGEEGVTLKHRVDVALVGRQIVDPVSHEKHITGVRGLKPADNPQRCGFAASAGS